MIARTPRYAKGIRESQPEFQSTLWLVALAGTEEGEKSCRDILMMILETTHDDRHS